MIDEKRLPEMMEPDKLRELAEELESMQQSHNIGPAECADLDCAAAVLREVAGRPSMSNVERHRDIQLILLGDAARTMLMEHGLGEDDYVVKALHDNTARLDEASIGEMCANDAGGDKRKA